MCVFKWSAWYAAKPQWLHLFDFSLLVDLFIGKFSLELTWHKLLPFFIFPHHFHAGGAMLCPTRINSNWEKGKGETRMGKKKLKVHIFRCWSISSTRNRWWGVFPWSKNPKFVKKWLNYVQGVFFRMVTPQKVLSVKDGKIPTKTLPEAQQTQKLTP